MALNSLFIWHLTSALPSYQYLPGFCWTGWFHLLLPYSRLHLCPQVPLSHILTIFLELKILSVSSRPRLVLCLPFTFSWGWHPRPCAHPIIPTDKMPNMTLISSVPKLKQQSWQQINVLIFKTTKRHYLLLVRLVKIF